jgi:hypothetical protein
MSNAEGGPTTQNEQAIWVSTQSAAGEVDLEEDKKGV